jgi:ATP-binding cassette subfamily C (CFTR/MRP) protein 4
VQALALGYLLQSFEVTDGGGKGYLWAGILVLSGFVVLMEHHHVFFWTWRRGMQYRISSIAAIYDKSLRLNSTSNVLQSSPSNSKGSMKSDNKSSTKASATSGQIVNIATNDVERFLMATLFGSYLFWAPVQSLVIFALGWWVIGWSFAAGFGVLILFFVPLQLWLSKRFATMRSKIASITDRRVTLVSQAVSGVRVMKMQGWEDNFESRIAVIRKAECEQIEKVNSYRALNEAIFFVSNVATSVIIFLIHVGSGGALSPRNVFTTMVLVNIAQMEITKHLSLAVMGASECWVSVSRIQRFIQTPELEAIIDEFIPDENDDKRAIIAKNVTCHWNRVRFSESKNAEKVNEDFTGLIVALNEVDLEFRMGQLTCIIGAVGSGKSAFVSMLAGELPLSRGTLKRRAGCTMAYAPQDPWIMDGTVKENILLGLPYEAEFYSEVINACGLNVDFAQLRRGEETIVGDRGVQLSGGQRARIALARAFYRNTDIIILDDPLSAVDSRVGRLLFYSGIVDLGLNRMKCVVLVTHQHQFIAESRCVLMSDGKIKCVGSYQECVDASAGSLSFALQHNSSDDLVKIASAPQDRGEEKKDEHSPERTTKAQEDKASISANKDKDDHKETSQVGVVKLDTFLNYLKAMPGGLCTGFFMLILFIVTQGSVLVCIAAVARWSELPPENQGSSKFIGLVVGLVAAIAFLAIVRAFMSFHLCLQASKRLHDDMTRSVLRAKIEFFDTNPLGRILNRFSGDVGSNDDLLPTTLFDFLVIAFLVLGALISAVSVLPVILLFVPPLGWYFLRVRRIFVTTSRELKRLEGLARSPIFAMLSESLGGIATIRSNGAINFFKAKFRHVHDGHSRAFFAFISCSRWLGFRMDALMFILITISSFAAVIVHEESWFKIDPGILGLAISLLIQLSGLFQWCIRQSAEVVNQMVAVERVIGFRDLSSEAAFVSDGDDDYDGWPNRGEVKVKDLCVRYRKGLPLSLRGITFRIDAGSRVGVVGRTGGGKSTLVQSLLRLLEAESGQIIIDGVDISSLGLHKLRNKVSVIPQSPILYGGCSLRDNLDPFHAHTDEQIKSALKDAHVLNVVTSLSNKLDSIVAEGGLNFSVGQRQLLCLARAILRKNNILVLDEPTASVDSRTDKLLQDAVSKSFADATIIAVAHRLETVIDYDKILVLGGGRVLEYGSPHELIERDAVFASMVNDTGEDMAATLKMRARNRLRRVSENTM